MRNLLAIVVMLSIFLFGIGTALAVEGVADDVPGMDVVFPIICEGHLNASGQAVFGSLNTIWAIADKGSSSELTCTVSDSVCVPHDKTVGVVRDNVFVQNSRSVTMLDTTECWSRHDVISNDCQTLINAMSPDHRRGMLTEVGGVSYFAGYVVYSQAAVCSGEFSNRFMAWVYLQDVVKGFSAGFNGVSGENGFGPELGEDIDIGISAHSVYPRYFLLNDNPDTFNWWIFLLGRNEYTFGGQANLERVLACFICDENENCTSEDIPIPDELNIINVSDILPSLPGHVTYPHAGFAFCDVSETGYLPGQSILTSITGTMSFTDDNEGTADTDPEVYTLLGWSYQRAIPVSSPSKISVIHPIHRTYCARGSGGGYELQSYPSGTDDLPYRFSTGWSNNEYCDMTGPVPPYGDLPTP